MTAAWNRALNVRVARYINVNAQAQKGHVTFRYTLANCIPAVHGIAAIVTGRSFVGEERLARVNSSHGPKTTSIRLGKMHW